MPASSFERTIRGIKREINANLNDSVSGYPYKTRELFSAAQFVIKGGGHRWRPILFLMIYRRLNFEGQYQRLLPVASAIELLHNSSIVLDDLPAMDNGTLRRGKKTCHLMFGEARAILTAFWLCDIAQH